MNLSEAQTDRKLKGELLEEARVDSMVEALCDKLELANADRVGPAARQKLKGILNKYRKSPKPFTECVADNTKRFGPEGAKKVCAVLKDIIKGTTKWRGKGKEMSKFSADATCPLVDLDDESFLLFSQVADLDYKTVLGLEA